MSFEPSGLKDPLALTTAWTPLRPGGASFTTHRLVSVSDACLQMKPTAGYLLFGLLFVLVGVGISLGGLVRSDWFSGLFGLPFAAAGASVLWPKLVAFDREARRFTVGGREVTFSSIHALQLVAERIAKKSSYYMSYELNVVLTNGERINVVDHAGLEQIRGEARQLGALIGCKVWDSLQSS